ncbi:unannotated protein [freshwater metagenome]|uniref:Unannotated protein n=1 Tax=freshwater metagenome TaxID=449393 RepID=A0A6J7E7Y1_9ZZZZ|nr:hypothetical protein [Actinomycetota bacterium]
MSAEPVRREPPGPLTDVPGPSMLGGGRRRALELLWIIAVTDFKKTYFGTALGYLWALAKPLLLFGVLLLVFTQIFRIGSDVPDYPVLLLFNIVLFGFFQEATNAAVGSVVAQEAVVRKTQFPRLVIPLSVILTTLFTLGLNLTVVFVFVLAWGVTPTWTWLLFPVLLGLLVALTTGISLLLSALYPRLRDLGIIWSVLATVLFYGTPVLYPLEIVPQGLRDVIALNPLTPLFTLARRWIIDPSSPTLGDLGMGGWRLAVAAAIGVGVCALGLWVFRREASRIAEQL